MTGETRARRRNRRRHWQYLHTSSLGVDVLTGSDGSGGPLLWRFVPDLSPFLWLLALFVTAAAAAIQGLVGVGYGMVAVPVLALLNPALSPVPQLLTVIPLTVLMAWRERSDIDFNGVGWLLIGRIPGAAIGVGLLAVATTRFLDFFIGIVVFLAVIVLASGFSVRITPVSQFGAGVASGATSLVASIGGPPTALLYSGEKAATIRSTLAAVFTIGVLFTIAVRFVTGNVSESDLGVALVLAPGVVVGWFASTRLKERIPQGKVRSGVLLIAALAALALIVRAMSA